MKKQIIALLSLLLILLLVSCAGPVGDPANGPTNDPADTEGEGVVDNDTFKMIATVESVGAKIEVNVTEAEYAFGIYWVITTDTTEFLDENGGQITRADIKVGDTVEIRYNGQVMMSYPPQIVALRIIKL